MNGLNWQWIAVMVVAPPLLAPLLAYPCWRRMEMILGNMAGTVIILGTALVLIVRESTEINRAVRVCLDAV